MKDQFSFVLNRRDAESVLCRYDTDHRDHACARCGPVVPDLPAHFRGFVCLKHRLQEALNNSPLSADAPQERR